MLNCSNGLYTVRSDDNGAQRLAQLSESCVAVGSKACVEVIDLIYKEGYQMKHGQYCSDSELSALFDNSASSAFRTRFIFLSQKNSWQPLSVTPPMLNRIITQHDMMPQVVDMISAFQSRISQSETGYCLGFKTRQEDKLHDLCYHFKYAAAKKSDQMYPWVIRQMAVYHQYHAERKQTVFLLINPTPQSLARQRVIEYLRDRVAAHNIAANPMLVHTLLIDSKICNWKGYCSYYESSLEKIYGNVATTLLSSPLHIGHDTLLQVSQLEKRFLPLHAIMSSLQTILLNVKTMDWTRFGASHGDVISLSVTNCINEVSAHAENAQYLLDLTRSTRQQISETLNFKNQDTAQGQSKNVLQLANDSARDSVSIRVITLLTLWYLPFSFIATVMGMNFFEMDTSTRRIVVSPQLWIYFCISIPLTLITILSWKLYTLKSNRRKSPPVKPFDEECGRNTCELVDYCIEQKGMKAGA